MKIVFFTRHQGMGASSRYRSLQYFDALRAKGHKIVQSYFYSDAYLRERYAGKVRYAEIAKSYFRRLSGLLKHASSADAIVIEKESFPFLPAISDWLAKRRNVAVIYDYDDAIWHSYEHRNLGPLRAPWKGKIPKVIAAADHVIVGSHYLQEQAEALGAKATTLIPTTVPSARYTGAGLTAEKTADIVWIGSMSTGPHLQAIFPTLERLYRERGSISRMIGFPETLFDGGPPEFAKIVPWSADSEIAELSSAKIGVMPLPDSPFERGKCGFKLVQYMGAGLPVVASPVGENRFIVDDGETGFLAETPDEWYESLTRLLDNPALAGKMATKGHEKFLSHYSTERAADRLHETIVYACHAKKSGR